jgi:hypothetical protein
MKINTIFAAFYKFYAVETMKLFRKWEGIFMSDFLRNK